MKWNDEYAVGIQEIDEQHQVLIDLLAEFEQAVAGKAHWNTVQPLIARIREYVKFHFAVEESLMQIVRYPGLAAHRSEHQLLLEQITALEHRVLRQEDKEDLLSMLHSWLFEHIISSDQPFGRHALDQHASLGHAKRQ